MDPKILLASVHSVQTRPYAVVEEFYRLCFRFYAEINC